MTDHPSAMIRLLNRKKDNLKRASFLEKADQAEGLLETVIATMEDHENRIRRLERSHNPQFEPFIGPEENNPNRGDPDNGEK